MGKPKNDRVDTWFGREKAQIAWQTANGTFVMERNGKRIMCRMPAINRNLAWTLSEEEEEMLRRIVNE